MMRRGLQALAAMSLAGVMLAATGDETLRPGMDGVAGIDALSAALRVVQPGRLLRLELDDEDGRPVYEVKLLTADGRVVKLLLDARSLAVLERRAGRHDEDDDD